ncbi:MAG: glycerol dehydrogenase [Synergistaceae bacterium]|jgi:glycerol dehydrogenase|nr:glycerol dehydrogenase [Synergistaceae bacterium]
MERRIYAPSKYIQGSGEIFKLPDYIKPLGKKGAFTIASPGTIERYGDRIKKSFADASFKIEVAPFNRECSKREIDSLIEKLKKADLDVVVGIGGGKAIDTAKAVSHYTGLPVVIVPTIASTDAPCSALAVIYTDGGVFENYLFLKNNPNVVIVDVDVIASAPARLLVSGMGDALSTYFEARACDISRATAISGGKPSKTAVALAELCYNILIEDGLKAKISVENHVVSTALENIIEANTFLSGVGFESGGLAAAHAIHNGFTVLPETHSCYHGEKVAFGTIVQLVIEDASDDHIFEVITFCKTVGLPTTLAQLGVKDVTPEKIKAVAAASCAEGETIYNMHTEITVEKVMAAITIADKLGGM